MHLNEKHLRVETARNSAAMNFRSRVFPQRRDPNCRSSTNEFSKRPDLKQVLADETFPPKKWAQADDDPPLGFCQTFQLKHQGGAFYCFNDIFQLTLHNH